MSAIIDSERTILIEKRLSREDFLDVASEIAELLLTNKSFEYSAFPSKYPGGVIRTGEISLVGVYGSVARGKPYPNDLEMGIFAAEDPDIREMAFSSHWFPGYSAQKKLKTILAGKTAYPVSFRFFPTVPSRISIIAATSSFCDPNFLCNSLSDMLIYNPSTKRFKKKNVYVSEILSLMRQTASEVLRDRLKQGVPTYRGNIDPYDWAEKAVSFRRRKKLFNQEKTAPDIS